MGELLTPHFAIPYPTSTPGKVNAGATDLNELATKVDTVLWERLLNVREHAASFTAVQGEYVKCNEAITVTLPAPSASATVAVSANNHKVTITAGSATISGAWWYGLATVSITGFQSVVLQSDGTNWYVIGQPAMAYTNTSAATYNLAIGEYLQCGANCTVTLPPATQGAELGLQASGGNTITITAAAGIYSDNIAGVGSLALTGYQHIILRANGTSWVQVSGSATVTMRQVSELESGREPIPTVITHTARGMDLPSSPRWGERVIIAVEPASFSAEVEAARVNRPIWEFVYYGRWYFIGGAPIVAFHIENQTIAGNGTWQVIAPVVYAPYPRMVVRVNYGAQLGATGGTMHATIGTSVIGGQAAGQGPSILTLSAGISTLSTMAWAQWWFSSSEEYLAHFGASNATYEHGYRYTEILPIEIIP